MVILQKQKEFRLSEASIEDLSHMRNLVDPLSSLHQPSIMYLWFNADNSSKVLLFDNFFLALLHPLGDEPFWTISGKNLNANDVYEINEACRINSITKLSNVPQNMLESGLENMSLSQISESTSSFNDYIYDINEQSNCVGHKFVDMRYQVRHFFNIYGKETKIFTTSNLKNIKRENIDHLFDNWLHFGTDGSANPEAERLAFDKLLELPVKNYFSELFITQVVYKNNLVGLSLNEINSDGNAINHFHKANLNLSGISYYLFYTIMNNLEKKHISYLNLQEDCGIEGLKLFKHKMRPAFMYKYYVLFL